MTPELSFSLLGALMSLKAKLGAICFIEEQLRADSDYLAHWSVNPLLQYEENLQMQLAAMRVEGSLHLCTSLHSVLNSSLKRTF